MMVMAATYVIMFVKADRVGIFSYSWHMICYSWFSPGNKQIHRKKEFMVISFLSHLCF